MPQRIQTTLIRRTCTLGETLKFGMINYSIFGTFDSLLVGLCLASPVTRYNFGSLFSSCFSKDFWVVKIFHRIFQGPDIFISFRLLVDASYYCDLTMRTRLDYDFFLPLSRTSGAVKYVNLLDCALSCFLDITRIIIII
jgi:hypothetical protein